MTAGTEPVVPPELALSGTALPYYTSKPSATGDSNLTRRATYTDFTYKFFHVCNFTHR